MFLPPFDYILSQGHQLPTLDSVDVVPSSCSGPHDGFPEFLGISVLQGLTALFPHPTLTLCDCHSSTLVPLPGAVHSLWWSGQLHQREWFILKPSIPILLQADGPLTSGVHLQMRGPELLFGTYVQATVRTYSLTQRCMIATITSPTMNSRTQPEISVAIRKPTPAFHLSLGGTPTTIKSPNPLAW